MRGPRGGRAGVSTGAPLPFEQWEQKYVAFREEVARETAQAIGTIQQETETQARSAQAAAAESLKMDLPRWLAAAIGATDGTN